MNTVKPVSSDTTLHDHPVLSNHFPRSQIFQPFITISVTFTSIKWFSPVLNGHFGNIQIKLRIIFQVKFHLCLSPKINVNSIFLASFCSLSGQSGHKMVFFHGFIMIP